jgi:hypothetical protein
MAKRANKNEKLMRAMSSGQLKGVIWNIKPFLQTMNDIHVHISISKPPLYIQQINNKRQTESRGLFKATEGHQSCSEAREKTAENPSFQQGTPPLLNHAFSHIASHSNFFVSPKQNCLGKWRKTFHKSSHRYD